MKLKNTQFYDKRPACRQPAQTAGQDSARAGRILVVDSDPAIRGLIASSLRHLGHMVTEAEDPLGALAVAGGGQTFDLVMTDVQVRAVGGVAMARKLLESGAAASILFMTESVPLARALTRSIGAGLFIAKPFTAEDLKRRIDEILRRVRREKTGEPSSNVWAKQRLRSIGNRTNRRFWRRTEGLPITFDSSCGERPQ